MSRRSAASTRERRIEVLIRTLRGADGTERKLARQRLARIGKPAVPTLTALLRDESPHARWEAAKALVSIADPGSAWPLVRALEDEDGGVRWLAAEGLIALERDGVVPVLQRLFADSSSTLLRRGAHHVLSGVTAPGLAAAVEPVVDALDSFALHSELSLAASGALRHLKAEPEVEPEESERDAHASRHGR